MNTFYSRFTSAASPHQDIGDRLRLSFAESTRETSKYRPVCFYYIITMITKHVPARKEYSNTNIPAKSFSQAPPRSRPVLAQTSGFMMLTLISPQMALNAGIYYFFIHVGVLYILLGPYCGPSAAYQGAFSPCRRFHPAACSAVPPPIFLHIPTMCKYLRILGI